MSGNRSESIKTQSNYRGYVTWTELNSPSLWIVVFVFILATLFYLLDVEASWDSSTLTLVLNILFVVIPVLFIAVIASWSFVRSGSWQVVWLGIGTLSYGLAVFMAMWTRTWASTNASRTIFTIIYLIAGLVFFMGSMFAIKKVPFQAQSSSKRRLYVVLLAYFLLMSVVALATFVSVKEFLPTFFIPDTGSTDIQLVIQGIAIALFLTSGLIVLTVYLQSQTTFLRWYGLGLLLTVINAVGNLALTSYGTPFNWILRGAQLLAGIYLTIAAVSIIREARARHVPATESMADPFTQLEARLKQSEARFSTVFEHAEVGIAISDMEGRITESNPRLEQMLGYTKTELKNRLFTDFTNADDAALEWPLIQELIAGKCDHYEIEKRYIRKDGQIIWVRLIGNFVRGEKGEPTFGISLIEDITEQKQAKEALQRRQNELQGLFDFTTNASLVLFDAKPPYTVLAHNKYYQELWAEPFRTQGLVGKNILDYVPRAEVQGVKAIYDEVVKTKKPKSLISFPYEGMPQGKTWWNWHLSPIIKDGEVISLTHIGINVTEEVNARQKVEEQAQLLEEKNEQLKRTNQKINEIIDSIQEDFYVLDRDWKFVYASKTFTSRVGKEPKDFVGNNIWKMFPKHTGTDFEKNLRAVMDERQIRRFEIGGKYTNAYYRMSAFPSEEGITILGSDITEQRKAEEALKESEAKANALIKYAPTGIYEIDFSTGSFLNVNDAMSTLTGYTREELLALGPAALLNDESKKVFADRARRQLAGEKVDSTVEYRVKKKDGSFIFVNLNVAFSKVNPSTVFVIGHDITERKKAEDQLRESEERFRALSETSPIGVGVSSVGGVLLYANPSYELILGYNLTELIGKKASDLYWDPKDRQSWVSDMKDSGIVRNVETRLKRKDGTLIWVSINASPVFFGGKEAVMGTIQDITERKEAEEALKRYAADLEIANKELESFSYSVSHDLRAPLRGIDGFSDALLEDCEDQLDEKGKDYLKRIRSSSQLMSQLIDGLLKLSRFARVEMHPDKVNLSGIVRSISEELKQSQSNRNAEFIIPQEIIAYGDRILLDAVLRNLLENAWKFTAKCPETRIEFGVSHQDGKPVYYVKDNGIGFDMQYSDKLFKAFSRLHNQNDYPGTGIGLANVQRIVRRHDGRIWADSEVGKGATFYFTLNMSNPTVV
jgi:PAS domain S-box-containing protein